MGRGAFANVAEFHLVEGLAAGDHGVDVLVGFAEEVHDDRPRGFDHFLDAPGDVFLAVALDAGDAEAFGELGEIGVGHLGIAEAALVEEFLPLLDHALEVVVEDGDFDGDFVFGGGGEFLREHDEGGIAVDVDHQFAGAADLRADGGGDAVAHGAQAAGGDHAAGLGPADELGGPHLVLADAGGEDGLALRDLVDRFDDGLRFGEVAVIAVGEGELLLPEVDLVEPGLAVHVLHVLDDFLQAEAGVADDGDIDLHVFGDGGGINIDVDDFGFGGEHFEVAGDAVVEACADGDEAIGFLDGVVGVGGAVHAEHVEGARIAFIKRAEAEQGGGAGEVGFVGELADFFPCVGKDRAAADVEDGAFGGVDHVSGGLGHFGMAENAWAIAGHVGGVIDGFFDLVGGDIHGEIDEHGAGAAGGGDEEGFVDDAREVLDGLHEISAFGDGPDDAGDVGFLEGVVADHVGAHLT